MKDDRAATGRFLVMEGLDGAGTTTQTRLLVDALNAQGRAALDTREPSDGPIGTLIRLALHKRLVVPSATGAEPLNADTLTLLFSADRLEHLQSTIDPALKAGTWVVCDRYDYSTRAYQAADAESESWVRSCNDKARRPDLVFFLRIDAETALARLHHRESLSIFETRTFLERVVARYDAVMAAEANVVTLDATHSIPELHAAILDELARRLGRP